MRIALLAEIDGNAEVLEAALRFLDQQEPSLIIALGLLGRGPNPGRVVDLLRARSAHCARGPADDWLVARRGGSPPVSPAECLRANRRLLEPGALIWLDSLSEVLELELAGRRICAGYDPVSKGWKSVGQPELDRGEELVILGAAPAGWLEKGERLSLGTGSLCGDTRDPRSVFVILDLESDGATRAEVVRIPHRISVTERSVRRRVDKGQWHRRPGHRYLRAVFGKGSGDIEEVRPDESGARLACHLIVGRARDVYRPLSSGWPNDDVDLVHQSRVATRRLQEALTLLGPILPRRQTRAARDRVRKLRQALGARRVTDVQIEHMRELFPVSLVDESARLHILHELERRRYAETRQFFDGYSRERLLHHGIAVLDLAMHAEKDLSFKLLATRHLRSRVERSRELMVRLEDAADVAGHHEFRKSMKRLRYAVELIAPTFPSLGAEGLLDRFKRIQEALGRYNDMDDIASFLADANVRASLPGSVHGGLSEHFAAARGETYAEAERESMSHGPSLFDQLMGFAETDEG